MIPFTTNHHKQHNNIVNFLKPPKQEKMAIPGVMLGNTGKEIVFFDLETNVPHKTGQKFWVLEFGAIVVCPRKLTETESYCTLIRPGDLSVVAIKPGRVDGITREEVAQAPSFEQVASKIFSILDGRIWAGHNIQRFDCVRIRQAFAEINMPAPVPAGIIDSLGVLSEKFGRRAGDMKMATLATYFGLGEQKHRSLEDARMNLEVIKHCATVLLLESTLPPSVLSGQRFDNCSMTTRSRALQLSTPTRPDPTKEKTERPSSMKGKLTLREETSRKSPPSASVAHQRPVPYTRASLGKMTTRMTNFLCNANSQRQLNSLLKHSQSLLR